MSETPEGQPSTSPRGRGAGRARRSGRQGDAPVQPVGTEAQEQPAPQEAQGAASEAAPDAQAESVAGAKPPPKPPPVPPQGYDPEGNDPIDPPSAGEMLQAAIGMAGELARTGATAGWRALTDAVKRVRP